jgi:hypothetical protein
MAITEFAKQYHERMFPGYHSRFLEFSFRTGRL